MGSPLDNLNTIADVARLGIFQEIQRLFNGHNDYKVELSNIGVRVYKNEKIVARIYLYSKDVSPQISVNGQVLQIRFVYDDPMFFIKVAETVGRALGAL